MLTKAPKGTKDILPSQIGQWHYVERAFFDICRRYGFSEIRTPVFEHTELFARSVGNTTDIVEKQMYTFDDYGGRSLTLRPEGTSPVARAFVEHKLFADAQPVKFCYEIPCFRYERPQSGRLREFHQFGVETFGAANMIADAEVIALAAEFLTTLGVKNLELRINNIGCPRCRAVYRDALRAFLKSKYDELCDTCKGRYERNPMRILDCKTPACQSLLQGAPVMLDYLCSDCAAAFAELKQNLTAMDVPHIVDPGIVRGLDYYTKTAFEFVSGSIGAQGTVCGGGRYDHLVEEVGGPPTPGVGFGLGIERLLLVMEAGGTEIPRPQGADAFIACLGETARQAGIRLMQQLRQEGLQVEMDALGRNIKGQFKYADRVGARHTVVLGDDELAAGAATVKDMHSGEQVTVPLEKLTVFLRGSRTGSGKDTAP